MYELEYLPSALKDMTEIIRYISRELNNPTAADNLAVEFTKSADRLKDFPYSNKLYTPIRPLKNEYRKCIVNNYIMFYSVNENKKTVTIYRVIYAKRDYDKII